MRLSGQPAGQTMYWRLTLWGLLVFISGVGHGAPPSDKPYQRFFAHYVDNRSITEKALNLVSLTSQDVGRSFALVAGVTQYPNMPLVQQELKPAAEDLRHLEAYLRDQEFFDEVVVLKDGDVTYEHLQYFLQIYFPDRLRRFPKSRFLFAYSGHGMADGPQHKPTGYLLKASATSLQDKTNSIPMHVLRVLIDQVVEAGHQVLVLINACYSGAFLGRSFGPTMYLPRESGAHAITAGGSSQLTWHLPEVGPGSIFFEKVFAGLGGPADAFPVNRDNSRGDGVVTVDELATYLRQEVNFATKGQQIPIPGDISRHSSLGGFFFLNRKRQVASGNVTEWKTSGLSTFGVKAEQQVIEAMRLYEVQQYTEAKALFEEAANKGHAEAAYNVGWLYQNGRGVPQDYALARQWYEKAAAAGNARAMNNLGWLYQNGWGVPQDYALARQWYEKAATAGNARTMANLGRLYENGEGVPQDYTAARQWYEKAAAAGDEDARKRLLVDVATVSLDETTRIAVQDFQSIADDLIKKSGEGLNWSSSSRRDVNAGDSLIDEYNQLVRRVISIFTEDTYIQSLEEVNKEKFPDVAASKVKRLAEEMVLYMRSFDVSKALQQTAGGLVKRGKEGCTWSSSSGRDVNAGNSLVWEYNYLVRRAKRLYETQLSIQGFAEIPEEKHPPDVLASKVQGFASSLERILASL